MSDETGERGNTWGAYLKKAREAKGLSIDDLADEAEVSRMTIIRWESGKTGFKHETITRVAGVLGVDPNKAIALARGNAAASLPPPLPAEIARLVDNLNALDSDDRGQLLDRVAWVNEWAEMWMRQRQERETKRHQA
ncbi:helix-turn-helix transcriptional regulator [Dactylosporangium roseum]|uniref:Helix-turn-helix transcriptional regulator n=1 Tax=Dactylosporangium roseum TaxID=47989 RepID=A0ABY5Z8F8_9ACTN|nr:helix-turn-helix transcriptional regulator [Dactylosporangium roseum]UWZ37939.1 helix-turn-helix transcriptional regulator [Dactylosporangium roseum]